MIFPPEPGSGDRILTWAREVQRVIRDFDRRLNAVLPRRPRREDERPAAEALRPFALSVEADGEVLKVRVRPSTLAGGASTDLGFTEGDEEPFYLDLAEGVVQGGITLDEEGAVTSRWLEIVEELSADTDDDFHVEIGTVAQDGDRWLVTNSRYGPIAAQICRRWYATAAPWHTVTWL